MSREQQPWQQAVGTRDTHLDGWGVCAAEATSAEAWSTGAEAKTRLALTEMKLMGRWPPTRATRNTRKGTPTIGLARLMTQLRPRKQTGAIRTPK